MSTAKKWSNVAVAMESALGSNITITAISKASQGVVTATNTLSKAALPGTKRWYASPGACK